MDEDANAMLNVPVIMIPRDVIVQAVHGRVHFTALQVAMTLPTRLYDLDLITLTIARSSLPSDPPARSDCANPTSCHKSFQVLARTNSEGDHGGVGCQMGPLIPQRVRRAPHDAGGRQRRKPQLLHKLAVRGIRSKD